MKQGLTHWKRITASSVVLAVLIVITAAQAPAAESKDTLSAQQVKALVASAKTPADHTKLARHYAAMADKHEAEAKEHEALAVEYTRNPQLAASKHPMSAKTAEHCKFYAEHCRKAAKEMREMSAIHQDMAKPARAVIIKP